MKASARTARKTGGDHDSSFHDPCLRQSDEYSDENSKDEASNVDVQVQV